MTLVNPHARAAYRDFDVAVARLVRRARAEVSIPCADDCGACCFDVAWTIQPEVDELAERVRSMPIARIAAEVAINEGEMANVRQGG